MIGDLTNQAIGSFTPYAGLAAGQLPQTMQTAVTAGLQDPGNLANEKDPNLYYMPEGIKASQFNSIADIAKAMTDAGRGGAPLTYEQWQRGSYNGMPLAGADRGLYDNWARQYMGLGTQGRNNILKSHGLYGPGGWKAEAGVKRLAPGFFGPSTGSVTDPVDPREQRRLWGDAGGQGGGHGGGNL